MALLNHKGCRNDQHVLGYFRTACERERIPPPPPPPPPPPLPTPWRMHPTVNCVFTSTLWVW